MEKTKKVIINCNIYLKTIVSCFLLIIKAHLGYSQLIIEYNSEKQFALYEDGNITVDKIEENYTQAPTGDALIFERNNDDPVNAMLINNNTLYISGEYVPNSVSFPLEGFKFENTDNELVAEISLGNDFFTKGLKGKLINVVTYIDDISVFESYASDPQNHILKYENINSSNIVEGKIIKNGPSDIFIYYITDHLGSVRAGLVEDEYSNASVYQDKLYYSYGKVSDLSTKVADDIREGFTGKEFDEDGYLEDEEDPPNVLSSGIKLNHFGSRLYDPLVGIWLCPDKAEQFINKYSYTTNPVSMIDKNGDFILTGFIVGFIREYGESGDISDAFKSGGWAGVSFANSWLMPTEFLFLRQFAQGLVNMVSNGWNNWNEALEQFYAGYMEGTIDHWNTTTLGVFNETCAKNSGKIRAAAYNYAHDNKGEKAKITVEEAIEMNDDFGKYIGQGLVVKWGCDLQWWHGGQQGSSLRYTMARAKREYLIYGPEGITVDIAYIASKFINEEGEIDFHADWGGQGSWDQRGHALGGTIWSHDLWFYGFETYGEPYTHWDVQDWCDDHGLWSYMWSGLNAFFYSIYDVDLDELLRNDAPSWFE